MNKTPKISIITPSYNQSQYLEETIRSVIDQQYPNLEYIVIDGRSTDYSVEIIKKYSYKLTYWISEKDRGQSHAINKGFAKSTGDIVCWLNSDDLLTPGTLDLVAKTFTDTNCQWLTGNCGTIDGQSNRLGFYQCEIPETTDHWLNHFVRGVSYPILQPSTFWCREVMQQTGLLNESLHYAFDHEFFYRLLRLAGKPRYIDKELSLFRLHDESKTVSQNVRFKRELKKIGRMYIKDAKRLNQIKLFAHFLTHQICPKP